jgi:undecaprenyl-diphosphatase
MTATPRKPDPVGRVRGWWNALLGHVTRRERSELAVLLAALGVLILLVGFLTLADNVVQGDTLDFDQSILRTLRRSDAPGTLIGPPWLRTGAIDVTALGSPTILGLVVLAVTGYLLLYRLYRTALFVLLASSGGWVLNWALKIFFDRSRPSIVPHLREVASSSFPSGHALTSAAVFLTLGALLMRLAQNRLAKFYCIAVAMFATFLVGTSRIFLGVHYPTDVAAGWLIGLSWALLCWVIERTIERRMGLQREQRQHKND